MGGAYKKTTKGKYVKSKTKTKTCNIGECKKTATMEAMTMDLDLKPKSILLCNSCLKTIERNYPVVIDGTKDEIEVRHN